jgi:hypothetical protein
MAEPIPSPAIDFEKLEPTTLPKLYEAIVEGEKLDIGNIVSALLPYLFSLAGLLLLLYLLFGGFQLMTSAGDPKKMQEAKGKLTNALVGFFIVFISYWLVQIVGTILGIEVITNIFK